MEEDNKRTTVTTPAAFISEIMLALFGLSGIAVIGVHLGYFQSLSLLYALLGLFVGISSVLICVLGIYVLLRHDYYHLKLFTTFFGFFIGLQLTWIVYLYFSTNNTLLLSTEQEGSMMALDVCLGLSVSALVVLCFHVKQKGSTIEMVKL